MNTVIYNKSARPSLVGSSVGVLILKHFLFKWWSKLWISDMNKLCMESRIVCPISSFKLLVRNTFSRPFLTFGEKFPCVLGNSRVILDLSNNVKRGSLNFFSKKYCCHIFCHCSEHLNPVQANFYF